MPIIIVDNSFLHKLKTVGEKSLHQIEKTGLLRIQTDRIQFGEIVPRPTLSGTAFRIQIVELP